MTSALFARIGLAASVAGLMVFSVQAASAQASACPGQVSIAPSANMIPAPSGMPLNCTAAFYDGTANFAGRVTGYAADAYTSTTTIYDQVGQLVGVTNSLGETTILGPEHGVLSTLTDPLGHATSFTYDPAGSVVQVIAPMASTTSYTYDPSERVTTVTDPLGGTTSYGYDSQNRMTTSVDVGGDTTTNSYDSSGRLAGQSVAPSGDTTTYTYDPGGNLIEVSDNHGDTTTYMYDGMDRLISETITPPSGGLTTTITYDPDGDVATVTESDGIETTYTYDALNRLIQETETMGSVTDITAYTYDPAGNLISVSDPADNVTKLAYDAFGDLISMTDPNGGVTTFAYSVVPEPSTWVSMLLGFAGLALAGRRRAKRSGSQSSSPASAAFSLSAACWALRQCGAIASACS